MPTLTELTSKTWSAVQKSRRLSETKQFEIRSDIPVEQWATHQNPRAYPYRELEIGESFFIEGKRGLNKGFKVANEIPGRRFISRSVCEDGVDGVRVWRVE